MAFDSHKAIIETLQNIQKATLADSLTLHPAIRRSQTSLLPSYEIGSSLSLATPEVLSAILPPLIHEATSTLKVTCHFPASDTDVTAWAGSILVFPLRFAQEFCGTLTLVWQDSATRPPTFSAAELGASMLSPLLSGIMAFDANQFYIQALEYMGVLPTEFHLLSSAEALLDTAGHTASVLLDSEHYAFFLPGDSDVVSVYSEGIDPDFASTLKTFELPSEMLRLDGLSFNQHHTLALSLHHAAQLDPAWRTHFIRFGVQAFIAVVIHAGTQILGTMWLFYHRLYVPSDYDSQLAEILASQLAAALQNNQLLTANRHHAEFLEQRVKERTQELATALEKAESADKLKSELLSTVSHELRTPLAVIKAHTSTELVYYDRLPKERHIQFLETVDDETDRLTMLINSLLDMSRLEAGALDIRPTTVEPIFFLRQLASTLQNRYTAHAITVKLPESQRPILADPARVEQLMNNLVDNAAKFSPPTTSIEIGARPWDDALELWVKDQGDGLSQEQAQHVFERFYKSTDLLNHRSGSGIGLGLAICKGLAESMGGRIWCETNGLKQGSRFAFTLPWAAL